MIDDITVVNFNSAICGPISVFSISVFSSSVLDALLHAVDQLRMRGQDGGHWTRLGVTYNTQVRAATETAAEHRSHQRVF